MPSREREAEESGLPVELIQDEGVIEGEIPKRVVAPGGAAVAGRHDGRPRRPLRALRRASGSRLRLRLRPGSARPEVLTPRPRVRVTASRLLRVRGDASWSRSDGKRRRQTEKNLPKPAKREPTETPSAV